MSSPYYDSDESYHYHDYNDSFDRQYDSNDDYYQRYSIEEESEEEMEKFKVINHKVEWFNFHEIATSERVIFQSLANSNENFEFWISMDRSVGNTRSDPYGRNLRADDDESIFRIFINSTLDDTLSVTLEDLDVSIINDNSSKRVLDSDYFSCKEKTCRKKDSQMELLSKKINFDNKLFDYMTIKVNLTFRMSKFVEWKITDNITKNSPTIGLVQEMASLMMDDSEKTFTDFAIVCNDKKRIPCHKFILAARSQVFKVMFNHDEYTVEGKKSEIEITDFKSHTVEAMIKFFYSDKINRNEDFTNYIDLYRIADKYDIFFLKLKCEKILCSKINMDNLMDLVHVCQMYNLKILKSGIRKYISSNLENVMESDDVWSDLRENHHEFCIDALLMKLKKY